MKPDMHVRALILDEPDWLTKLVDDYKIHVVRDGRLASLKYNMLESPMEHPLVQECRGMVVDVAERQIRAHPYNKFWNHGETGAAPIDWSTARVQEKLDGSLMILYHEWGGEFHDWHVASSGHPTAGGSFGASAQTFREAFWEIWNNLKMGLPVDVDTCYMFELCALENRIVVRHETPRLVVHGARNLTTGREVSRKHLEEIARDNRWEIVKEYPITSITECLEAVEALDPIANEGFVVVDADFNRVKIKSRRYVILHHMKGESTPRRAIELWQTGETSELLGHFPEMAPLILPIHERLDQIAEHAYADVLRYSATPTRKEYAAIVKDLPWASVCFKFYGEKPPTLDAIKEKLRAQTLASLERMVGVA